MWRRLRPSVIVKYDNDNTAPVGANETRSGHGAGQGSSSSTEKASEKGKVTENTTKKQLCETDDDEIDGVAKNNDDHRATTPIIIELDAESSMRSKAPGFNFSLPKYMLTQSSSGPQGHDENLGPVEKAKPKNTTATKSKAVDSAKDTSSVKICPIIIYIDDDNDTAPNSNGVADGEENQDDDGDDDEAVAVKNTSARKSGDYPTSRDRFLREFKRTCKEGIEKPKEGPLVLDLISALCNQDGLSEAKLCPEWHEYKEKHPERAEAVIESARLFLTPYGEEFSLPDTGRKKKIIKKWHFFNSDYIHGMIPAYVRKGAAAATTTWFKRKLFIKWAREDKYSEISEEDTYRDGLVKYAESKDRLRLAEKADKAATAGVDGSGKGSTGAKNDDDKKSDDRKQAPQTSGAIKRSLSASSTASGRKAKRGRK